MITQAVFKNFKCLRDVQINLERFTIFVGPNSSGKSSILQAFGWFGRSEGDECLKENNERLLLSRSAKEDFQLYVKYNGDEFKYRSNVIRGMTFPDYITRSF